MNEVPTSEERKPTYYDLLRDRYDEDEVRSHAIQKGNELDDMIRVVVNSGTIQPSSVMGAEELLKSIRNNSPSYQETIGELEKYRCHQHVDMLIRSLETSMKTLERIALQGVY